MKSSKDLLFDLLSIPSPTYNEQKKCDFLEAWLAAYLPNLTCERINDNLIATFSNSSNKDKDHIAFVGHIDTVPEFFKPYEENDRIFGSGASDMQAGLASMLWFIKENFSKLQNHYQITVLIYSKEEGTPLRDNGLNELIRAKEKFIKSISLAIVGEPTNNTIQLGCVGSIHYLLKVLGKAAHSARPWHGENALYKAVPIIKKIAELKPKKQSIFGVDFFDVLTITESQSSRGKTTIPKIWEANINYRFSPVHSMSEAKDYVETFLKTTNVEYTLDCLDAVDAGKVIIHPLLERLKKTEVIEAKQAWTDVAQLTALNISAFNFGPGRQDQAHQPNEYVSFTDMKNYEQKLIKILLEEK